MSEFVTLNCGLRIRPEAVVAYERFSSTSNVSLHSVIYTDGGESFYVRESVEELDSSLNTLLDFHADFLGDCDYFNCPLKEAE